MSDSPRYEYRHEVIPLVEAAALCNRFDEEGWELFQTCPLTVQRSLISNGNGGGEPGLFCLLRRRRQPQQSANPDTLAVSSTFQGVAHQ